MSKRYSVLAKKRKSPPSELNEDQLERALAQLYAYHQFRQDRERGRKSRKRQK